MLLDTNILIAYLNGEEKAIKILSEWKISGKVLFISTISKAEVLALPQLSSKDIDKIRDFLNNFFSISFDDLIAEKAAFIRRSYKLKLPDAGIAATALVHKLPLVTRDRQFRKIKEITSIEI